MNDMGREKVHFVFYPGLQQGRLSVSWYVVAVDPDDAFPCQSY